MGELGVHGFEPCADVGVRARRSVADADEEMGPEEKGRFAWMDRVGVEVRGARDREQLVAIGLDLRKLVRLQRILDRERVETKALGDALKFARGWLIEAEPEKIAIVPIVRKLLDRTSTRLH